MKILLVYFSILVFFYAGYFDVDCVGTTAVIKANLHGMFFGQSGPALAESSVILPVEVYNRCYLTNSQFVTNNMNPLYSEFLFACPPDTEDELDNNGNSKTKNALFIKKVYKNPNVHSSRSFLSTFGYDNSAQIIEQKCQHPVIPSIINVGQQKLDNPDINLYLIGYEIFLGEERMKSYIIDKYDSAELPDKRFAWFNLYTIAFNHKTRDVVSVFTHAMNGYRLNSQPSNDPSPSEQKLELNYTLGTDIFYGEDFSISAVYKEVQQTFVFGELFEGKTLPNKVNFFDWAQNRYLEGVHLAPLEGFGIPLFKLAGQTFGNVAPMWRLIYEVTWSNIQTHIKYLVRGINGVNVITGTYGTLTLAGVEIYLKPNNSVRVPAAFWKIVSYSRKEGEIFNIVIATINNPYENIENPICPISQCKEFGWDNIEQEFYPMGLTSCCELTEKILSQLQIGQCMKVDKTLDLNQVPHWEHEEVTLNIKLYIENQIWNVEIDKHADDAIYNSKKTSLGDAEDEEASLSKFLHILYENFGLPLWSYVPSIPFMSRKSDSDLGNAAASDQKNGEESSIAQNPIA